MVTRSCWLRARLLIFSCKNRASLGSVIFNLEIKSRIESQPPELKAFNMDSLVIKTNCEVGFCSRDTGFGIGELATVRVTWRCVGTGFETDTFRVELVFGGDLIDLVGCLATPGVRELSDEGVTFDLERCLRRSSMVPTFFGRER